MRLDENSSNHADKNEQEPASLEAFVLKKALHARKKLFLDGPEMPAIRTLRAIFTSPESYGSFLVSDQPLSVVLDALWTAAQMDYVVGDTQLLAQLSELKNEASTAIAPVEKARALKTFLLSLGRLLPRHVPRRFNLYKAVDDFAGSSEHGEKVLEAILQAAADIPVIKTKAD